MRWGQPVQKLFWKELLHSSYHRSRIHSRPWRFLASSRVVLAQISTSFLWTLAQDDLCVARAFYGNIVNGAPFGYESAVSEDPCYKTVYQSMYFLLRAAAGGNASSWR